MEQTACAAGRGERCDPDAANRPLANQIASVEVTKKGSLVFISDSQDVLKHDLCNSNGNPNTAIFIPIGLDTIQL